MDGTSGAYQHSLFHNFPYGMGGYGGYGGYGNDRNDNGLAELILSNQVANGHQDINNQVHSASVAGLKETSDSARDTVDAVRDAITATNQIGNINLQSTERNGGETRSSVERTSGETRDTINSVANQAARDAMRNIEELCNVRKEVSDHFAQTNLEMAKQHCDIKLEAAKQHAELARQLAECCCELKNGQVEIKNEIVAQACATREADLKRELDNQRQELLLLKMVPTVR